MIQNVSVVGLGKLGASMLAGMASRGFTCIGVDIAQSCVGAVNELVVTHLLTHGAATLPELGDAVLDTQLALMVGRDLAARLRGAA